ncbi:group III truncated hemoglobin [Lewinella sp. 4G2]|uniref:group III truncated hemoglobin n=1 Tax=Lewinella sp. 4G2 TaxID=1803372 RepID=UPI0007B45CE3|nr:group III truncated hemoglobin [Lewinella sp. 4G2]OAV43934.1 hypothetical protein A3850_005250 [Lewinella sp. 4G2]
MKDIKDRSDIEVLVATFYQQAREDELLGPVFFGALGEGDWSDHLEVVTNFWCTVLLKEASYPGGFMWKHMRLPIGTEHVLRWGQLFTHLVNASYVGPVAEEMVGRVSIMQSVLITKLSRRGGGLV